MEEGKAAFETKNDVVAEKSLKKAIEEDNNFIEAVIGLANLYQVTNRHIDAIDYFKKGQCTGFPFNSLKKTNREIDIFSVSV